MDARKWGKINLDSCKQRLFVFIFASGEGSAPSLAFCERERRGSENEAESDAPPVQGSQRHGSRSRKSGGTSAARRLGCVLRSE